MYMHRDNYQQASVLVIDDNPDHWLILQGAFKTHLPQVKTIWTTDANNTFAYLDECLTEGNHIPKLIFLDLYLPTCQQGKQLLRMLKEHLIYHKTPVVVISYSNQRNDIRETYDLGSSSYVVKPIELAGWSELMKELKAYWWDTTTLLNLY